MHSVLLTVPCHRGVALIPISQVRTLRHQPGIAQGHPVTEVERGLGARRSRLPGVCSSPLWFPAPGPWLPGSLGQQCLQQQQLAEDASCWAGPGVGVGAGVSQLCFHRLWGASDLGPRWRGSAFLSPLPSKALCWRWSGRLEGSISEALGSFLQDTLGSLLLNFNECKK